MGRRALCVQSVPVLVATELLPRFGLLRLRLWMYYGYGYPAYYGYYALRSEPGFYRRPYYGYYRGY